MIRDIHYTETAAPAPDLAPLARRLAQALEAAEYAAVADDGRMVCPECGFLERHERAGTFSHAIDCELGNVLQDAYDAHLLDVEVPA